MLDVLSRTLDDQEEVSVQVDQRLGQLLPRHLPFRPCRGLPELRQSYHDRAVQLDLLLYLRNLLEHIESSDGLRRSHRGRPQIRLLPDLPRFVVYQERARVPRDANFPMSRDNYRRKQDLQRTTRDQFCVRTISECIACLQ